MILSELNGSKRIYSFFFFKILYRTNSCTEPTLKSISLYLNLEREWIDVGVGYTRYVAEEGSSLSLGLLNQSSCDCKS